MGIFDGGLNGDGFFGEEYDSDDLSYSSSYTRAERSVTCRLCGQQNLKWIETPMGWRTAYSTGLLKNKLHGCGRGI